MIENEEITNAGDMGKEWWWKVIWSSAGITVSSQTDNLSSFFASC